MRQLVPFYYCMVIGAAALLGGLLLGIVFRSVRARRQADRFKSQIHDLELRLNAAARTRPQPPMPIIRTRWTGGEVAAVVGTIGTFLVGLGGVYVNLQGRQIADKNKTIAANAIDLATATRFLGDSIIDWDDVKIKEPITANRKHEYSLDDRDATGDCHGKVTIIYGGQHPAVLHCGAGVATVQLDRPSKLLFVAENRK